MLKKKWIHAIGRDEGKDLKISESTKVCSRHFRKEDLKKTLVGKICLKSGAVPSISLDSQVASQEKATNRKVHAQTSFHDFCAVLK